MDGGLIELSVPCIGLIAILGLIIILGNAIRIVPEYRRLVVFRLGRLIGKRGPGLVLVIPFIDRAVPMDLREQKLEIKHVMVNTWDKFPAAFDVDVHYRVADPAAAVLQVADLNEGLRSATARAAGDAAGRLGWADLAAQQSGVEHELQDRLGAAAAPWGVTVVRVEMRNVTRR